MSVPRLLMSIPAVVIAALIRGYQIAVSPLLPSNCRFTPSCSAYALTAVRRFGAVRGSWLAVRRLLRCQPFCAGGHDPVPDRVWYSGRRTSSPPTPPDASISPARRLTGAPRC